MTDQPAPGLEGKLDVTTPSSARMYDYFLGGKENYEVDREAAEQIIRQDPSVRDAALANRHALRRTVTFLARDAGIGQFVDIGSGLPTQGNVHEVAQRVNPQAKVVYTDKDRQVLIHNQALLTGHAQDTITIWGDLRQPGQILNHPELHGILDLSQPVAVLLFAVLHFVTDDDEAARIVARLVDAMAPGSWLAVSHVTTDYLPPATVAKVTKVYQGATAQARFRSRETVGRFFDGLQLVEPGLVRVSDWRPDHDAVATASTGGAWGVLGVAKKP